MNQKISEGMFVKIHPKFCEEKIPQILLNRINYTFIDNIRNSQLKVIGLFYKYIDESDFYNFLVNSNNQDMIRFRIQLNMNSTLSYENGYKRILMARIETKGASRFHLPVCFLIESSDVPLSIY